MLYIDNFYINYELTIYNNYFLSKAEESYNCNSKKQQKIHPGRNFSE